MKRTSDEVFRALKPAALDDLTGEAYARKRGQDLGDILTAAEGTAVTRESVDTGTATADIGAPGAPGTRAPRRLRGVPWSLPAGVAAATVAAVTAGIILTAGDRPGGQAGHLSRPAGQASADTDEQADTRAVLDARTILLASARSAAKAPATHGACWYTRIRETRPMGYRTGAETAGRNPAAGSTSNVDWSYTSETWSCRDLRARKIVGIDQKLTFASASEEARWKARGIPGLPSESDKPRTLDYRGRPTDPADRLRHPTAIGALSGLPADLDGLRRELREWYEYQNRKSIEFHGNPMHDAFAEFVFGLPEHLLAGPTAPGTKAAFYRVLAEQKGIRSLGKATDGLGRTGVVLARDLGPETGPVTRIRLVIDPDTGRLLERRWDRQGSPTARISYEEAAWVDRLGARP